MLASQRGDRARQHPRGAGGRRGVGVDAPSAGAMAAAIAAGGGAGTRRDATAARAGCRRAGHLPRVRRLRKIGRRTGVRALRAAGR